jgi:hypothetical protein
VPDDLGEPPEDLADLVGDLLHDSHTPSRGRA